MTGTKQKPCESCHAPWKAPQVEIIAPREVVVNSSFEVYAMVMNHGENEQANDENDDGYPYLSSDITLKMGAGAQEKLDSSSIWDLGNIKAGVSKTGMWSLQAGNRSNYIPMVVEQSGRSTYVHNTPQKDHYDFIEFATQANIQVRDVDIKVSTPLLLVKPREPILHRLVLWSDEQRLTNVTFGPIIDSNIQWWLDGSQEYILSRTFSLEPGRPLVVEIEILASSNTTALLPLRWTGPDGEAGFFNLTVVATPATIDAPEGTPRLFGRTTGMVGLGLLVLTGILGGGLGLRKGLNLTFRNYRSNARQRIRLHCWIAFSIFIIGLAHAIWLIFGAFSGLGIGGWGLRLWLGWGAWVTFGLLALHGYYQRPYIRRRGYREWTRVHQYLALLALMLLALHGLLVGTDTELVQVSLALMGSMVVLLGARQIELLPRTRGVLTRPETRTVEPRPIQIGDMERVEAPVSQSRPVTAKHMSVECPHCLNSFVVPADGDRQVRCPKCTNIFTRVEGGGGEGKGRVHQAHSGQKAPKTHRIKVRCSECSTRMKMRISKESLVDCPECGTTLKITPPR